MTADELSRRVARQVALTSAQAQLALLRPLTALPEGPLPDVLGALAEGEASGLGLLISPRGKALGVAASGAGMPLGRAMVQQVRTLLNQELAALLGTMAHYNDFQGLELEILLGQPSWLSAGIRIQDGHAVRVLLEEEQVPREEIDRLLRDVDRGQGRIASLHLTAVVGQGPGLSLTVGLGPEAAALPKQGLSGLQGEVLLRRAVGRPETAWIRRPGLQDDALLRWQLEQGIAGDAAGRMGAVHGILGVDGPTSMVWPLGHTERAVYRFDSQMEG